MSFNFYPAKPEMSERDAFILAFRRRAERGETTRNVWILKPSDGGKGERIKIIAGDKEKSADGAEILAFIDSQPEGSIAWVVSEYIERPLLLPGNRKFDWRLWVLLGSDYEIRLYKEGVLRFAVIMRIVSETCNNCICSGHAVYRTA